MSNFKIGDRVQVKTWPDYYSGISVKLYTGGDFVKLGGMIGNVKSLANEYDFWVTFDGIGDVYLSEHKVEKLENV